ncbi:MAG: hypothetical protein M3Y74_11910, partial [Chloroflexota bacterium]|nr:hypothetical protein [Chloroflexota bacterium]
SIEEGAGVPAWSPDGAWLAFVTRVGEEREPKEKDEKERLRKRPFEVNELKSKFDALGHFRGRRPQIFLVSVEGGEAAQLTSGPYDSSMPAWSPDGTRIAYESGDASGGGHIFVMNADGSAQTQLTNGSATDFGPVWSPDGTRIAFVHGLDTTERYVYIMNADGSDPHAVHPGGLQFVPSWQPHGDD